MNKVLSAVLILAGIFLFHFVVNSQIITLDHGARIYDENGRIMGGLRLFEDIFQSPSRTFIGKAYVLLQIDHGQGHPRFFELIEAVVFKILSMTGHIDISLMILFSNAFFLFILLISVTGIGARLYDMKTGLLAAFFITMFPLVAGFSRLAMIDFSLMAMIAFSFYLLLRTNGFTSTVFSFLTGVVFGLAQLTKESALFFILFPLVYYFLYAYANGNHKKILFNFIIIVVSFLIVAGAVYGQAYNLHVYDRYFNVINMKHNISLFYYIHSFVSILGPWVTIAAIPLAILFVLNFKKEYTFLLLWILVPFLLFSFSSNKTTRFILPIAPALALIFAGELMRINLSRFFKFLILSAWILLVILQYGACHLGYWGYPVSDIENDHVRLESGIFIPRTNTYSLLTVNELFSVFKNEVNRSRHSGILILFNEIEIKSQLEIKMKVAGLPFWVDNPLEGDDIAMAQCAVLNDPDRILEHDYVLENEDCKGHDLASEKMVKSKILMSRWLKYRSCYKKIATVAHYDNSFINVYKRIDLSN